MSKIALLRYHHQVEVCRNRLELFAHFNPDVPVFGLYGGEPRDFDRYTRELDRLRGNYCLSGIAPESKWKSVDLALKEWFQRVGHAIPFTQLYLLEWDFVLFDRIEHAYRNVPEGSAGFSGLTELRAISGQWWWTRDPEKKAEWQALMRHVRERYGYDAEPLGMLCPGLTLPRRLLEGMDRIDLPELGNDELRLPLMAQLLGVEVRDTGFHRRWFSRWEHRYFNCNELPVSERRIMGQLHLRNGRRAFHPYRGIFEPRRIPTASGRARLLGVVKGLL
jgi:hypothetical protein